MIKTGNNSGISGVEHFLFTNNASLNWAVLDLDVSFGQGVTLVNIGKVSHIVELNGQDTPVPEPGTMVLLGVGMLGLAIFGKRRMSKNS